MPVQSGWLDAEETVRYWQFEGKWTWAEFFDRLSASTVISEAKPYPVATILDFSGSYAMRDNALGMFATGERRMAQNVDLIVCVGGLFIKSLVDVYTRVSRREKSIFAVSTLDEASALIQEKRASGVPRSI